MRFERGNPGRALSLGIIRIVEVCAFVPRVDEEEAYTELLHMVPCSQRGGQ